MRADLRGTVQLDRVEAAVLLQLLLREMHNWSGMPGTHPEVKKRALERLLALEAKLLRAEGQLGELEDAAPRLVPQNTDMAPAP